MRARSGKSSANSRQTQPEPTARLSGEGCPAVLRARRGLSRFIKIAREGG
jgi:hypothetical protein